MIVKYFIGTKIKNIQCNVVAKSLSLGFWFGVVALARNSSFIFLSVGISRWQKNECAVCALAFLVQMLMFSTIFCIMHNVFV